MGAGRDRLVIDARPNGPRGLLAEEFRESVPLDEGVDEGREPPLELLRENAVYVRADQLRALEVEVLEGVLAEVEDAALLGAPPDERAKAALPDLRDGPLLLFA